MRSPGAFTQTYKIVLIIIVNNECARRLAATMMIIAAANLARVECDLKLTY